MLENMPLSAYGVCYGPLALIILGFIVFASLTDAHARRTYLRRMDPRPESERPDDAPIAVTSAVRAQTPAGASVSFAPAKATTATVPSPTTFTPPSVAPAKPVEPPPSPKVSWGDASDEVSE